MSLNLPFLTRHTETYVVQGKELTFHAMTYGMVMRLRTAAKPVLKALSVLFADKRTDTGQESVTVENKDGDKQNRLAITAASPDVIRIRSDERALAIDGLLEGLLGGESGHLIIDVLCNSLPDDMPQNLSKTQKMELAEKMPMETLVEMLHGVFKANEKLLAPFKERAGTATTALRKVLVPEEDLDESPQKPSEPSKAEPDQTTNSG